MTHLFNVIVIAFILLLVLLIIYFLLKKDHTVVEKEERLKDYRLDRITAAIKDTISAIQNTNISELHLNEREAKKREELKYKLDRAIRVSSTGDIGAKEYLKEYISELLLTKFRINELSINYIVPFTYDNELSIMHKFDILQYIYRKENIDGGFAKICEEYELARARYDTEGNIFYYIDEEDIQFIYKEKKRPLSFVEKLDLVSQWIYQSMAGHGVIDMLREDKTIDSICGGVSGVDSSAYLYTEELLYESRTKHSRYDSVWVVFRGKTMRLKFMTFGSKTELERVTHNLYRNGNPGWMSALRGYVLNDTKDGDRITCCRPPFTESFGFFIRKFGSVNPKKMENLLIHDNSDIPIAIIRTAIKGCLNIVFSGEQDSGKTTMLKAAVGEIDNPLSIRTIEIFFEMWLSRLYPDKNIMAFKNTDNISVSEAISLMKKSTGNVMIAGESADHITAAKVVELALVGTKFTLSSCHPITADGLIEYHTNAVMSPEVGLYSDDRRAEASVAKALNLDVHMTKGRDGVRYIERITEIIPKEDKDIVWPEDKDECMKQFFRLNTRQKTYTTREIVVFENGKYVFKEPFSNGAMERIKRNIEDKDLNNYHTLLQQYSGVVV